MPSFKKAYKDAKKCSFIKLLTATIDLFKVNDAIMPGVQNYWGERKITVNVWENVGSFMLDNLRTVDILRLL